MDSRLHQNTDDHTTTFTRDGTDYSVTVSNAQLLAYNSGQLAQRAFPDLSPEQREFLISGMTPDEWIALFPLDRDIFQ